ncbi:MULTISPECIES: DKNYY domain-containing protein [unclassified Pseudoalteromonas]|uniref:DKNYY domain-containing protein n=1 Tax=unclassified Pseudoalteromonas TaxID=194690 RepID=UPI0038647587
MNYFFYTDYYLELDLFDNQFVSILSGLHVHPTLPLDITIMSDDCVLYEAAQDSIIDFSPDTLGYYWNDGKTCLRTTEGLIFKSCDSEEAIQSVLIDGKMCGQKIDCTLSKEPQDQPRYTLRLLYGKKALLKQGEGARYILEIDEKEHSLYFHEFLFSYSVKQKTGFYSDDGQLFYYDRPLPGLAIDTFMVLHFNYAKDKHSVVCGDKLISEADVDSFEVISTTLAKDKNHVYNLAEIIEGALPDSFEIIDGKDCDAFEYYCKDDSTIYYLGEVIYGVDCASFRLINSNFAVDDNWVYRSGKRISILDSSSFQYISDLYVADRNGVYLNDIFLEQIATSKDDFIAYDHYFLSNEVIYWQNCSYPLSADPASFISINSMWARDKIHIFYQNKIVYKGTYNYIKPFYDLLIVDEKMISDKGPIRGASSVDWHRLYGNFYASKDNLYYKDQFIDGGTPRSFTMLDSLRFKDQNNIYLIEEYSEELEIISDIDSDELVIVNEFILKTNNLVYFYNTVIKDANPKTFRFLKYGFSSDDKAAFCNEIRLDGLDPCTLHILNYNIIHDTKRLYYQCTPLEIEISQMVLLTDDILKDHQFVYYKGLRIAKADAPSYTVVNSFFQKDIKNIYHNEKHLLLNADETIFQDEVYAMDLKRVFFIDKEILSADVASFKILGLSISKDKNNVYFRENIIVQADPFSFKILGYNQFIDKFNLYQVENGKVCICR